MARRLNATEITKARSHYISPKLEDPLKKTIKRFKKAIKCLERQDAFWQDTQCPRIVKQMGIKCTLILTHRPVVNEGWFNDFKKNFSGRNDFFNYGSKDSGNSFDLLERNAKKDSESKYIYFASMQDLRGSETVGGNFNKNDEIFDAAWDLLIIDEAHEGTKTELGESVVNKLIKKDTKILRLSGTPFNLMDDFAEDEIYTWDYVMEQRAKKEWDERHKGDPNPYSVLPKLNIFTFDLGKLIRNFSDSDYAFNFHEFFRVDDFGDFIHEKEVNSFLNLICKQDTNSNYPYSTEEYRDNFSPFALDAAWCKRGKSAQ